MRRSGSFHEVSGHVAVLLLLVACREEPTAPVLEPPPPSPTVAFLRTVDSLNASMRRFYEDGGAVAWIGVTYDSAGVPTLHFSLRHPSLR